MDPNDRLQAAMEYAARGWHVVPLRGRGKKPWLTNWQTAASDDEETIARWFGERPQSNVGRGRRSWISRATVKKASRSY